MDVMIKIAASATATMVISWGLWIAAIWLAMQSDETSKGSEVAE